MIDESCVEDQAGLAFGLVESHQSPGGAGSSAPHPRWRSRSGTTPGPHWMSQTSITGSILSLHEVGDDTRDQLVWRAGSAAGRPGWDIRRARPDPRETKARL